MGIFTKDVTPVKLSLHKFVASTDTVQHAPTRKTVSQKKLPTNLLLKFKNFELYWLFTENRTIFFFFLLKFFLGVLRKKMRTKLIHNRLSRPFELSTLYFSKKEKKRLHCEIFLVLLVGHSTQKYWNHRLILQ